MSGITPVLDTLLHQVLGRRVDIPVARDLNQPVGPVVPVEGARPLHSDSRQDARPLPQVLSGVQARLAEAAREAAAGAGQASRQASAPAAALAPSSTVTSFSAAARVIAELLQRIPTPAPIAPAQPLLDSPARPAADIAAQLQRSIGGSGLFYEAHVARWARGDLALDELRREPQAQLLGRVSAQSSSPAPGAAQEGVAPVRSPAAERMGGQGAAAAAGGDLADTAAVRGESDAGASEPLAALVRQQLELLAVPQLRWEGQVWAGVFMALSIEVPPAVQRQAQDGDDEAAERQADGQGEWKVQLALQLPGHGELAVAIRWRGERLQLDLRTASAALRSYFAESREGLRESLAACGFREVELRLLEEGDER